LVKLAMTPPREFPSFSNLNGAAHNWPFWAGLGLYGIAFLLYAAALARLPLNVAHPILTTGAIAVVSLLSVVIFREQLYWTTGLGIIFVVIGVALISFRGA
jgi:small multidrug resistance pump